MGTFYGTEEIFVQTFAVFKHKTQTFVEYIHFKKKIIWIFYVYLLLNIREYPMIGIELIPF